MNDNQPVEPDEDFDAAALEDASNDLTTRVTPPEVTRETENLVRWDEAPGSFGHVVPKVLPEDEIAAAAALVYEGVDEADHERRIAAADPDFEP